MSRPCPSCLLFRVFLMGVGGALLGAWLAPQLGFPSTDLLTPGIIGAMTMLALGVLIFKPRN